MPTQVERCRELRRASTIPERVVWSALRAGQMGVKFRRQHPLGPYVADFYCHALKLVIEVDGLTHNRAADIEHDCRRDAWMRARGYRNFRVSVKEVSKDLPGVIDRIRLVIARTLPPPPPASGRGGRLPSTCDES